MSNHSLPDPSGGANKPIPVIVDLGPIVAEVVSRLLSQSPAFDRRDESSGASQGLLSRQEAASYLRCSVAALDAFTKSGRLKCVKIDSRPRFRVEDIDTFVEQHVTSTPDGGAA